MMFIIIIIIINELIMVA